MNNTKKIYKPDEVSLKFFIDMLGINEEELVRRMLKVFSSKYTVREALDLLRKIE